jgi:hypothetical protein
MRCAGRGPRSIPAAVVAARKTDFSLKNAVDDLSISVYDKTNTKEPTIREREDEGDVEVGAKGARSIADWGTFTNSEDLMRQPSQTFAMGFSVVWRLGLRLFRSENDRS